MGLSDLGDAITWGEARLLLEAAASDPATAFGADLAGWAYPASIPELLSLIAQFGGAKASRKLMPWAMKPSGQEHATAAEIEAAEAALEAEFIFE